jgi:multiple sugar transport system permease protein
MGKLSFVGLANYSRMFQDPVIGEIIGNTAFWVFFGTLVKVVFGLILALYLNRTFKGKKVIMIFILLPWATPYIISSITWRWMFNPLYGHLNDLLLRLGIVSEAIPFLGQSSTALAMAMLCHAWTGIPFCALSFLSVLYSIPESFYDAARVDGAGAITIFRKITFPIILPNVLMISVLVSIWGFNAFGVIWSMTQGGPMQSSEILISYIYRVYFEFLNYGYGSAVSVVSFLILMALSYFYIVLNRRTSYE